MSIAVPHCSACSSPASTDVPEFFATCPKGLEYLLRDELRGLGVEDAREALAGVRFSGALTLGYRACLWSRLASRVYLRLAEFDAPDSDALYAGVDAVDWREHLAADAGFAVDAAGTSESLRNTQYIAQRVKDAVADQFRRVKGVRPDIVADRPDVRLHLRLHRGRATLSLDLSGEPLHRRGWREGQGEAPLKENLACAMLLRGRWPEVYANGGALVDPFCGAGTLAIEAAWMAADVAPGLHREHFGFTRWRGHDAAAWSDLLGEARARADVGLGALRAAFFGSDHDPHVLAIARRNAQAAGVDRFVQFARQSVEALENPLRGGPSGLLVANPPYGERLGQREALFGLYRTLGDRLREAFPEWRGVLLVGDDELGHALGLRADRRYTLFNGALECTLLSFERFVRERAAPHPPKPMSEGAQAVANRIAKNARHLRRRLERERIGCWRAYDADIPEFAAAIDVYTEVAEDGIDAESRRVWLHVQEYAPPREIPDDVARRRLQDLVRGASEALCVPRDRIAIKTRRRAKGGSKYGRMDQRGEFLVVEEGGLRFEVNLFDYLDTGLFLDHRPVRERIRLQARGKRFLNLFCYTATATAHAAAGGAATTTSVDLSLTYLQWATRNLALNGFTGGRHRLVQADAAQWLRADDGEYDLIFFDPPTFSNSKRANDFDVQRDHAALLHSCMARLAPGGLVLFSCNLRRFRLDAEIESTFDVRDITAQTIPFDFARNARIHRCYEVRHRRDAGAVRPRKP